MYRTEASRRNQWEGGIEKETERKLRGLRELRKEGRRSRKSGSEFASFARLREAGSRSAERFGPAKREDLKAREPGSLHSPCTEPSALSTLFPLRETMSMYAPGRDSTERETIPLQAHVS